MGEAECRLHTLGTATGSLCTAIGGCEGAASLLDSCDLPAFLDVNNNQRYHQSKQEQEKREIVSVLW